ncbi:hypothetical protein ACNHYB_09985 [Isoptericola jiangsuensis]|uniref:hypothetical protein n=1 Tax=Isoptericola jiangsuensis TaxID=548579 RepID=UPI003AB08979
MRTTTTDDVRAAVRWALAHDLPALLAYRQDIHLDTRSRWKADATLVARWQQVTGTRGPVLTPGSMPGAAPLTRRR